MEWSEAETVVKEITALWDNWKPNDAQTALWMDNLCGLASPSGALRAVRGHATESAWQRPVLAKILQQYYARSDGAPKRPEPLIQRTGIFVLAVSPRTGGRPPGAFRELVYPPGRDLPPPMVMERDAEKLRTNAEECEGGTWQIGRDTTYHAMMRRRRELRYAASAAKEKSDEAMVL